MEEQIIMLYEPVSIDKQYGKINFSENQNRL